MYQPTEDEYEERKARAEAFRFKVDAYLTLAGIPQHSAQTSHDHEEYARFYLSLLTDDTYQSWNKPGLYGGVPRMLWTDEELIKRARRHTEAARILKELDEMHEDDNES
jgi:hypothetical protein